MSKEKVKNFYDALAQDAALAEELNVRIAAATIEFAAEKGFEFTAEEAAATAQELSPEDLDNVNGGYAITPDVIRREYRKAHRNK